MRNALPFIVLAALSVVPVVGIDTQGVEQILQKTRDTYAAMQTYADTGVVVAEYGQAANPAADRHRFTTVFRRTPRAFVFDYLKQSGDRFVIWGDPDAFHSWWKTTGGQSHYPNPDNLGAFTLSGVNTDDVAMKIPTLLYGKSSLGAAMLAFKEPIVDGSEAVGGHACVRVVGRASDSYAATGREVNVRRIAVWIDVESALVRRVQEEWKPLPGVIKRVTVSYEPIANGALDPGRLTFNPPQAK